MAKSALVLFDIDGTLITSGGAGVKALEIAAQDYFGGEQRLTEMEVAGRTDAGITRGLFERNHRSASPEAIAAFCEKYLENLARELPRRVGKLMPGIRELLDELRNRDHVVLGLLTGNLQRGAKLKLTHYGIWDYFEFGAFADDHHERNELGAFARLRATEKHGIDFLPTQIFVIGDTPHDIACGKIFGGKTIAVATGSFSREQLAEFEPDYLFEDFSDFRKVADLF